METTPPPPLNPPVPPTPSRKDYGLFVERVQRRLVELNQSARWLEEQAELAGGTISKMKTGSGRVKLTRAKLDSISKWLGLAPESLVEATAFVSLLTSPPPSPEKDRIAELERDRDELRAQRAELEAQVHRLKGELAARDAELARAQAEAQAARSEADRTTAANQQLRQELSQLRAEAAQKGKALREAEQVARGLVTQLEGSKAQLVEAVQQRDQWRTYALDREDRVQQLEQSLQQLEQKIRQHKSPDQLGPLLLGGLIGLGLGSSGGNGRRR